MIKLNLIIGIGIAFIILLLAVLYFVPGPAEKRKKKKRGAEQLPKERDWKASTLKLERHIYSLRATIDELEKKIKTQENELLDEKSTCKRLQEKLDQEEGWHEKEQAAIEKRTKEVHQLKKEMVEGEQTFEKEHAHRLRTERKLKETAKEFQQADSKRRDLELKVAGLQSELSDQKKEGRELKRENRELKKKRDDTSWIAKTEYDKLQKTLKDKERELAETVKEYERFKRQIKEEIK